MTNSFDSLYNYVRMHNPTLLKQWLALREKEAEEDE